MVKLFIDFFPSLIKRHDIQIWSPSSWAPSQNIWGENKMNKNKPATNAIVSPVTKVSDPG